jgi:hypothetical protein
MSYPYPQDRHRDRKEKGEQPYKDNAEAYGQQQAELRRKASEEDPQREDDVPVTDLEREVEERLDDVRDELDREGET